MSVPGLVVLYGGVMQKRWSINSMMLTFVAFAVVLVVWVLWAFKMGFGTPIGHGHGLLLELHRETGPGARPRASSRARGTSRSIGHQAFPKSALVYFQFVFAAITPILMLGSVLGRVNFKAWIPFVALWCTFIYTVNAFLIWGGGFFAHTRSRRLLGWLRDPSVGRRVGLRRRGGDRPPPYARPRDRRTQQRGHGRGRGRVAVAGVERLQRRGPVRANMSAAAAILNTNLCTAVAFLMWVGWDYLTGRKPGSDLAV